MQQQGAANLPVAATQSEQQLQAVQLQLAEAQEQLQACLVHGYIPNPCKLATLLCAVTTLLSDIV